MAKKIPDREAQIAKLSEESLSERLLLAEEVCVLFGWSASRRGESPRDDAANEAWHRWARYMGEDGTGPKGNPRINAELRRRESVDRG